MKSIFIFTQTLAAGGAEKQAVMLGHILKEGGYNVTVVFFYSHKSDWKLKKELDLYNIKIIQLKGSFFFKIIKFWLLAKRSKPDLVINYLLLPSLIGGIGGKLFSIKSIGGIRSSKLKKRKKLLYRLLHNKITESTMINNDSGREELIKSGFNQSKFILLPNTIIIPPYFQRTPHPVLNILSVGRFTKEKDYDTALKTISLIKNSGINFRYFIVGWGDQLNFLTKKIKTLDLQDVVIIADDPKNLVQYYKSSDIFLQTSLFEGLSNSIMEAISYSLPVVATNVGDNSKLVLENINGFLCERGDFKSLAIKIYDLMLNHDKRIEFGRDGYQHLKRNYSYENMQRLYLELITGILVR